MCGRCSSDSRYTANKIPPTRTKAEDHKHQKLVFFFGGGEMNRAEGPRKNKDYIGHSRGAATPRGSAKTRNYSTKTTTIVTSTTTGVQEVTEHDPLSPARWIRPHSSRRGRSSLRRSLASGWPHAVAYLVLGDGTQVS